MTLPSILISTSIAIIISLSTSFSTVYHTSTPIFLSTITSIASQYSTLIQTASLTQPETIATSTLAFPITLTQSIPQILSSTAQIQTSPIMNTIAITQTITSTLIDIRPTITIDLLPWQPLTPTTIITTATETTIYPNVRTATLTQLDFVLEDSSGTAYTTFTTILSPNPSITDAIVFTAEGFTEQDGGGNGWSSWSDGEKGGLIAGVVIAGLLIIGLIPLCLMRRRRSIWVASDYVGPPQRQIQAPYAYWGPGPAGWGIRGGGDVK